MSACAAAFTGTLEGCGKREQQRRSSFWLHPYWWTRHILNLSPYRGRVDLWLIGFEVIRDRHFLKSPSIGSQLARRIGRT